MSPRLRAGLLGTVVALAFADSSVVVLGLPGMLREFETSVERVAWVVTAYNLAVAIAAAAMAARAGRVRARPAMATGLGLFLAASAGCALAPDLAWLVALRCAQGVGGALLLGAALPLLAGASGSVRRGTAIWAGAGAVGAVVGPALGGVLTEAWDWRAIFAVQAPVAAAALLALGGPEEADRPGAATREGPRADRLTANLALGLVSGATVGALFLVVTLLVEVDELGPAAAAAVVMALPAGTLAVRPLARAVPPATAGAAGALLLAGGLVALGLAPSDSLAWVVAALLLCGAGVGLSVPTLTELALARPGREAEDASWTTAARHAGLVVALALVAPLLSADIDRQEVDAERSGTALVLDADLPFEIKVPLAVALAERVEAAAEAQLPDLRPAFADVRDGAGSDDRAELDQLEARLGDAVEALVERSFRRSYLLSALLAGLGAAALWRLVSRELV